MKKIFYIITIALLLVSCYSDTTYETSYVDGTKEYVDINFGEQWSENLTVYRYEYDGHKYILFGDSEFNNGVVHDPDCPCHEQGGNKQETSDYPDWW